MALHSNAAGTPGPAGLRSAPYPVAPHRRLEGVQPGRLADAMLDDDSQRDEDGPLRLVRETLRVERLSKDVYDKILKVTKELADQLEQTIRLGKRMETIGDAIRKLEAGNTPSGVAPFNSNALSKDWVEATTESEETYSNTIPAGASGRQARELVYWHYHTLQNTLELEVK